MKILSLSLLLAPMLFANPMKVPLDHFGKPPPCAGSAECSLFDDGSYSYSDGCNTTTCNAGGMCSSTAMFCLKDWRDHPAAPPPPKILAWHPFLRVCVLNGMTYYTSPFGEYAYNLEGADCSLVWLGLRDDGLTVWKVESSTGAKK